MPPRPERYLLIGDEGDVPVLGAMLEEFPERAAGNVVLELPPGQNPQLPLPPGMRLTILPREQVGRGGRAVAALDAWVDEWLLGEHEPSHMHAVWIGMPGDPLMERRCEELLITRPGFHLHRPYDPECSGGISEHHGTTAP